MPGLVLRCNDPAAQQPLRDFAHQQAAVARRLHQVLAAGPPAHRAATLTSAFTLAEQWRYDAAAASPHPDGRYSRTYLDRFRTPVSDDAPNQWRIGPGEDARLRDGAVWDPHARAYLGGEETPASETMRRIGELARARFIRGDLDVVRTLIPLSGGRVADGTRIMRRAAARRAATDLAGRIAARGGDASRIITSGHLIYVATSPEADRAGIFTEALALLARTHLGTPEALDAWVHAAYLLYHAPRRKRGSDATIRTFLVAVGAHLLGYPPTLLHDLDLRAIVLPRDRFVAELHDAQRTTASLPVRSTR